MREVIIKPDGTDATFDVITALKSCDGDAQIKFTPGVYHFFPDYAYEKYYYISNNRHGLKRVAFPIIGKKKMTIDGGGSRFVFHGEILPFVIEQSDDITLKNFSVDWERPFYSQGTVVEADSSGVTLKIDREKYPYRLEGQTLIFEGEGWESPLTEGVFEMDSTTRAPAYLSGDSLGLGFPEKLHAEELRAGVVRFMEKFPHLPAIGNSLILRHYNRHCPGTYLKFSKNTTLEHVTLYHAGGMGVIAQFCENIAVKNCRVTPADGRIFSTMVDATHFVNCCGLIELDGCLFEGQLDDPCNVHGINTRIKQVLDSRTVITELVHYEQHGVEIGLPGDRVNLSGNKTLLSYEGNEIDSVSRINSQYSLVRFKNMFKTSPMPGHVIENMSWIPDVSIKNSTCRNNRARGLLISTPGKVVVENNQISASGSAIKISGDANYWFESGAVTDVLIRDNEFLDCCFGPEHWGRAVIDIDPEIANPAANPECFHRNIRIENNRFFTFDTGILFARSVDGIRFSGNTIRRTDSYPPSNRMPSALTFEACRNIEVSDNNTNGFLHGVWMDEISRMEEVSV